MNIARILAELREELDTLNAAIVSLERLQNVTPRPDESRSRKRLPPAHARLCSTEPVKTERRRLKSLG